MKHHVASSQEMEPVGVTGQGRELGVAQLHHTLHRRPLDGWRSLLLDMEHPGRIWVGCLWRLRNLASNDMSGPELGIDRGS